MAGIAFVIALHVVILYALLSGIATNVVKIITTPIETRLIEEVKPPPPPPPPPKKLAEPPPRPKHVAPPPVCAAAGSAYRHTAVAEHHHRAVGHTNAVCTGRASSTGAGTRASCRKCGRCVPELHAGACGHPLST